MRIELWRVLIIIFFKILKLIKEDDEGHGESQDDASTPGSTQALQDQQAVTDATSGKFKKNINLKIINFKIINFQ